MAYTLAQSMKIITLIALTLCSAAPLGAEVVKSPWLLRPHGAYIEMTEGRYRRSTAIETVNAVINVRYEKDNATLFGESFPLSDKGLADFKALDRTKVAGAVCKVSVIVYINGDVDKYLVQSEGDDPISDWDAFSSAVHDARDQVEKLLTMASKG